MTVYEEEGRDVRLWLRWHFYNAAFCVLDSLGLWSEKIAFKLW